MRWLRVRGRIDDAMLIMQRIAKFNGKVIPDGVTLSMPPQKNADEKKISPLYLFRSKKMAISSSVQGYAW